MNKGANMVDFMDQAIKGLRASVVQFGEDNINGIAANPPVTKDEYKKNETGIVSFLEGGAFASMINEDVDIKLKNETMKTLYAVAINEMWKQEQVYIVNTTGVMAPRGGSFELMKLDDDDIHRVNLDGTTFFLIKYSKDKSPAKKYEKVPGVDQLEHLGLTVEEVIHSSAYTMSKGGFNWNPSPEEWMSYSKHKADAPPANIFMNLPVCQFGSFGLSEYTTDVYNWKSICTSGSRTDDEVCLITFPTSETFTNIVFFSASSNVSSTSGARLRSRLGPMEPSRNGRSSCTTRTGSRLKLGWTSLVMIIKWI